MKTRLNLRFTIRQGTIKNKIMLKVLKVRNKIVLS